MVFSSPRFFAFLAAVLLALAVSRRLTVRKAVLAVASCVFYAAWDWRYVALLLAVSAVNYGCAARIAAIEERRQRRLWLVAAVIVSLGALSWFKYADFFLANVNGVIGLFGVRVPLASVLLPAGISFYTFKTLSYTLDVHRGSLKPCDSWLDYATFATFFPELIAGPIVRGSVFLPQMTRRIGPTRERLAVGASIFLQGLTKKLLIADRIASAVDGVFAEPALFSAATLWMALLGYAIQIYCDFSGYSDMAIGTARMIGYDLPQNFNMPYISTSIAEFWRRWHITLSSWFADYVFRPMAYAAGRRAERLDLRPRATDLIAYGVSAIVTMLLCGLWHGAGWNFVAWGGLHGIALGIHAWWAHRRPRRAHRSVAMGWLMTQSFVLLSWVLFRTSSFSQARDFLVGLAGIGGSAHFFSFWVSVALVVMVAGHLIGAWAEAAGSPWAGRGAGLLRGLGFVTRDCGIAGVYWVPSELSVRTVYIVTFWLLTLFYFAPTRTSPFIYFQF